MSGLCKSKKAMRLEIRRSLVLSTAHIPPDLAADFAVAAAEDPERAYTLFGLESVQFGYQMFVDSQEDHPPTLRTFQLGPAFDTAKKHRCNYLVFDQDGPKVSGLPVFDWDDIAGSRSAHVAALRSEGGLWWADYYWAPRTDWQAAVASGDTQLGYWDWVEHRIEAEKPPTGNTGGSTCGCRRLMSGAL